MLIKNLMKYLMRFFDDTKEKYPDLNNKILKSALVYQYLFHKHFKECISIHEIIELNNGEIGLMGPGNGCITWVFEKMFGWIDILNTHSILHDAFGRFYTNYSLNRGYTYAIPEKYTPIFIKNSPICGQISGIFYCAINKLII